MSKVVDYDFFNAHLEHSFTVALPDGQSCQLVLSGLQKRDTAPKGWESFTVTFDSPPEVYLAQATYELNSEATGKISIFLVPVAQDEKGYQYEAVFNRRID